jgi:hypothetical protein
MIPEVPLNRSAFIFNDKESKDFEISGKTDPGTQ